LLCSSSSLFVVISQKRFLYHRASFAIVAGPVLDETSDPEEAKAAAVVSKFMAVVNNNESADTMVIPGLEGAYTKVELHQGRIRSSGCLFDIELFRYLAYDLVKMSPCLMIVTKYKDENGYALNSSASDIWMYTE
jgi:hypothetical protein